ncbi:MAG: AAA family ATPase [bacterium]
MRIALTGSANVGKTTLFNALKNELPDYSFYPELAIQLIKQEIDLFNNNKLEFEERLYRLHKIREIDADFAKKDNIISDRCILDTLIYAKYHNLTEHFDREQIIKELFNARYDMIFIVFPFEPFKESDNLHMTYIEETVKLSQRGLPIALIERQDLSDRIDSVLSHINYFNQKPLGYGV